MHDSTYLSVTWSVALTNGDAAAMNRCGYLVVAEPFGTVRLFGLWRWMSAGMRASNPDLNGLLIPTRLHFSSTQRRVTA